MIIIIGTVIYKKKQVKDKSNVSNNVANGTLNKNEISSSYSGNNNCIDEEINENNNNNNSNSD